MKRWGEYFAVIATSIFLPLEVRDLLKGITFTRGAAFAINIAAVLYLLLSKHLADFAAAAELTTRSGADNNFLEVDRAAVQNTD